jgi:hypothetical protein
VVVAEQCKVRTKADLGRRSSHYEGRERKRAGGRERGTKEGGEEEGETRGRVMVKGKGGEGVCGLGAIARTTERVVFVAQAGR